MVVLFLQWQKMAPVRLFIAMKTLQRRPLYQLDVKNAFLNGDFQEEIYKEQPSSFVAQGESSGLVCCFHNENNTITSTAVTVAGNSVRRY